MIKKLLILLFGIYTVQAQVGFNTIGFINTSGDNANADFYYDVAIQTDGKILVVGETNDTAGIIARYTAAGAVVTTINEGGADDDPNFYYGVAIDSQDRIIAVGSDNGGNGVIKIYSSAGAAVTTINEGGADDDPEAYYGVTIDSQDRIVAVGKNNSDNQEGIIKIYTNAGDLVTTINEGTGNDESNIYYDVNIDSQGRIITAGRNNGGNGIIVRYLAHAKRDSSANWIVKNMQEHYKITNQSIGLMDSYK